MSTLIAIPSANPGGLNAALGMHFGHCEVFTLVTIDEGKVVQVSTMENPPHAEGGCLAPVQLLAAQGVKALLAGGMGFRPLMAFNQAGIRVYFVGGCSTVEEGVNGFIANQLPEFTQDQTCHGHGGHGCHS